MSVPPGRRAMGLLVTVCLAAAAGLLLLTVRVLRSPFTSRVDIGRVHYDCLPVTLLLRDRCEALDAIRDVGCPVLVLSGDRDPVVPVPQSRRIYDAIRAPKDLVIIAGAGHNDLELGAGEEMMGAVVRFLLPVRPACAPLGSTSSRPEQMETGKGTWCDDETCPTLEELAATVLIVAEDELQTVTKELGYETNFRVFADADAIKALQRITRDRPQLVVLGKAFVDTPRGAALVNTIKTDHTLANTQIRVISRADDYVRLVRRTETKAASEAAMPGEPLPPNYLGTRVARRYKLRPGLEMRVDGNPTTLVKLSGTGAQLVASTALRLNRRVRLVMGTEPDIVLCSGVVVWVSFKPRGKSAPRYRAGVQFKRCGSRGHRSFSPPSPTAVGIRRQFHRLRGPHKALEPGSCTRVGIALLKPVRVSGQIRAIIKMNREQVFSYPEAPLRAAGATRDQTGPSSS